MFEIGTKIVSESGMVGTVTYSDDEYVYMDPGNGSEHEFPINSVKVWVKPAQNPVVDNHSFVDTKGLFNRPYIPQKGDRARASKVIEKINEFEPALISTMSLTHKEFDNLDDFNKVKVISKLTGTPMVVFMGSLDMGTDEFLKKVLAQTNFNIFLKGDELANILLMEIIHNSIK